jgi:hypothetical protein
MAPVSRSKVDSSEGSGIRGPGLPLWPSYYGVGAVGGTGFKTDFGAAVKGARSIAGLSSQASRHSRIKLHRESPEDGGCSSRLKERVLGVFG